MSKRHQHKIHKSDQKIKSPTKGKKQQEDEHLNCKCKKINENEIWSIKCNICDEWFHGKCHYVNEKIARHIDIYRCENCIMTKEQNKTDEGEEEEPEDIRREKTLKKKIKEETEKNEKKDIIIKGLETEITILKDENKTQRLEIEEAKSALENGKQKSKEDFVKILQEIKEKNMKIEELRTENEILKGEILQEQEIATTEITTAEIQQNNIPEENISKMNDTNKDKTEINKLQKKIKKKEKEIEEMNKELDEKTDEIEDLNVELDQFYKEVKLLRENKKIYTKLNTKLEEEIGKLEKEKDEKRKIPCKFEENCRKNQTGKCPYKHPRYETDEERNSEERNTEDETRKNSTENPQKPKHTKECHFQNRCRNKINCRFHHHTQPSNHKTNREQMNKANLTPPGKVSFVEYRQTLERSTPPPTSSSNDNSNRQQINKPNVTPPKKGTFEEYRYIRNRNIPPITPPANKRTYGEQMNAPNVTQHIYNNEESFLRAQDDHSTLV